MRHPYAEASTLQRNGTPFVVVTMIASRGHAPQDPGAKALVTADGLFAGTVGGGKVEAKCIEVARGMLADPATPLTATYHWNLQRDIGMTCGGEVTYLFEKIVSSAWRVVVFGGGHVAQKMARVLRLLDCRATFIDSRPEWVEKFPRASNLEFICMSEPKNYLDRLREEKGVQPYIAIMTRGHATDLPVLHAVWEKFPDAPYVGVLGSKVKAIKVKNESKAEGFPAAWVDRVRIPMGLAFGTNDPAEIAISIVAEMIQVRERQSAQGRESAPKQSGPEGDSAARMVLRTTDC